MESSHRRENQEYETNDQSRNGLRLLRVVELRMLVHCFFSCQPSHVQSEKTSIDKNVKNNPHEEVDAVDNRALFEDRCTSDRRSFSN